MVNFIFFRRLLSFPFKKEKFEKVCITVIATCNGCSANLVVKLIRKHIFKQTVKNCTTKQVIKIVIKSM